MAELHDIDPLETQEWLDALNAVIENEGVERAHFLLERLIDNGRRNGANLPFTNNTAYLNTIPTHLEQQSPGNRALENRIRSFIRWNAMAMVVRANKKALSLVAILPASRLPQLYTILASIIFSTHLLPSTVAI